MTGVQTCALPIYDTMPENIDDVLCKCDPSLTGTRPIAWLEICGDSYDDCQNAWLGTGESDDPTVLQARDGSLSSDRYKPYNIVRMSCSPFVVPEDQLADARLNPILHHGSDDYDWLLDNMGLHDGEGVTYFSEELDCTWDGAAKRNPNTISIPP